MLWQYKSVRVGLGLWWCSNHFHLTAKRSWVWPRYLSVQFHVLPGVSLTQELATLNCLCVNDCLSPCYPFPWCNLSCSCSPLGLAPASVQPAVDKWYWERVSFLTESFTISRTTHYLIHLCGFMCMSGPPYKSLWMTCYYKNDYALERKGI